MDFPVPPFISRTVEINFELAGNSDDMPVLNYSLAIQLVSFGFHESPAWELGCCQGTRSSMKHIDSLR